MQRSEMKKLNTCGKKPVFIRASRHYWNHPNGLQAIKTIKVKVPRSAH